MKITAKKRAKLQHGYLWRIILFLAIGAVIWLGFEQLLTPKWYYPNTSAPDMIGRTITSFYEMPENSIDCLLLGVSHMLRIQPDELYEAYGFTSYNLGTPVQPIEVSYFLLEEALKTQQPTVVVLDVTNLFYSGTDAVRWQTVLDELKFSATKLKFAKEYAARFEEESLLSALCGLYRYHDRWESLSYIDFYDAVRNKNYYTNGSYIYNIKGPMVTTDDMNAMANTLQENTSNYVEKYEDGTYSANTYEAEALYTFSMPEENTVWLSKIRALCEENGISLLLTKIPSTQNPQNYSSAWIYDKYAFMKEYTAQNGYSYWDLLYDTSIDFDFTEDSEDYGAHLNFWGAEKATEALGAYLADTYGLGGHYSETWEADLETYREIRSLVNLQGETDFISYLNRLKTDFSDKLILMSASDDMSMGLTEEEKAALADFGYGFSFDDSYNHSYIAVIENGELVYECKSSRAQSYSGTATNGCEYEIESKGWYSSSKASIKLNGEENAVNTRGLNIVVYDEQSGLVLDCVGFDLCNVPENRTVTRYDQYTYLREYEYYLIEGETTR